MTTIKRRRLTIHVIALLVQIALLAGIIMLQPSSYWIYLLGFIVALLAVDRGRRFALKRLTYPNHPTVTSR